MFYHFEPYELWDVGKILLIMHASNKKTVIA